MSYTHQDWTPIILNKKKTTQPKSNTSPTKTNELKFNAGKNGQSERINARKIEQLAEEGDLETKKVSRSLQLQIQQGRQQKDMTRKELAAACQLPENTIRDYENGTCLPQQKDIIKIGKALGVVLKK